MKSNKGGVNRLALMMMLMIVSQLGDRHQNEENGEGAEHQEEAVPGNI